MGVFSDDFAAVDFREELCYHSRPKKAKFVAVPIIILYVALSKYLIQGGSAGAVKE